MTSELDEMFSDFDNRKQSEKEEKKQKEAKHNEFLINAIKIINEQVAPVLREVSADLKNRGHESEVTVLADIHSYPSVHMSFRVINKEPHSYTGVSKLSFSTTTSEDRVEVRKEIWGTKEKDEYSSYGGHNFKMLMQITQEWVKNQTISFVGSVLNKH